MSDISPELAGARGAYEALCVEFDQFRTALVRLLAAVESGQGIEGARVYARRVVGLPDEPGSGCRDWCCTKGCAREPGQQCGCGAPAPGEVGACMCRGEVTLPGDLDPCGVVIPRDGNAPETPQGAR